MHRSRLLLRPARLRAARLFAGASLLLSAACVGPVADTSEALEQDYTVRPTGGSATITVRGLGPRTDVEIFAQKSTPSGAPIIALAADTARDVSPGTYCLWTTVRDPKHGVVETERQCGIDVSSGKAVDYTLGQITFSRSCSDLVFDIDALAPGYDFGFGSYEKRGVVLARQTAPVPHAAGSVRYAVDYASTSYPYRPAAVTTLLNELTGAVPEGGTTSIDPCALDGRQKLRLLPPASRELPDYDGNGYILQLSKIGDDYTKTRQNLTAPSFAKPVLVYAPVDPATAAATYALRVESGESWSFTIPLAAGAAPVKVVQMGRIDVADVDVTKPDGTHVAVRGEFDVREVENKVYFRDLPTGHGLDVFPGTYEVVVSYRHPSDGAPMVDTRTVTIP